MKKLTDQAAFKKLQAHHKKIHTQRMQDWFQQDPQRFHTFSLSFKNDLLFDFSKHLITTETLSLLITLAQEAGLAEKIEALFTGATLNITEQRPVIHTALRAPFDKNTLHHSQLPAIHDTLLRMQTFTDTVRQQKWLGVTGKAIRDIVCIGIGGSDLGPRMATHALAAYATDALRCYFISDIDARHIDELLPKIDPERTLFILSSKSFTTPETLLNAKTLREWLRHCLKTEKLAPHFVAITAKPERAEAFGIPAEQIYPMWDGVGGRYSLWSAIGLPIALMTGMQHFCELLAGAHDIDEHFRQTDFRQNIPVIMGLLGIWYINFYHWQTHAIAPYADELRYLRNHIQQLDMESNGKSITRDNQWVDYATGPVIIGEAGCDSQHSFFQQLHQGPTPIPVDFILIAQQTEHPEEIFRHSHRDMQIASALSQAKALMEGKSYPETPYKTLLGNRPSTILFFNKLTPRTLGQLIALYEHKIFVQGVLWNINSFDQWGVELGKQLMPEILKALQNKENTITQDASTHELIAFYQGAR